MYDINWTKFVEERLPSPVRKVTMRAWVQALLAPVKTLHAAFFVWKDGQERDLKITPQVCVLRYWLNEFYDVTDRRFLVQDYENVQPILIWGESFNSPIYLPAFLSSRAYDLQVIAPCDARVYDVQIHAFLKKYLLAGKRYKLLYRTDAGLACPATSLPIIDDE